MAEKFSYRFETKSDKGILISPAKISETEWFCDNSPTGFARFYKNDDIVYVSVNETVWRMLGYPNRAAFIKEMSKSASLPVNPDCIDELNDEISKLTVTSKRCVVLSLIKSDGSTLSVDCTFSLDREGRKTYLCVMLENKSELRDENACLTKAVETKNKGMKYLASLVEDLPCGIIQLDAKYPYNVYSAGAVGSGYNIITLNHFGYPTIVAFDKIAKSKFRNLIASDDRDRVMASIKEVVDYGEKMNISTRVIKYDGSYAWLEGILCKAKTRREDDIVQFIFIDTTEIHDAQEKIIEQNRKIKSNETRLMNMRDSLEDIMKNLPAGISVYEVTNGKSRQKYISDNVFDTFGCKRADGVIPDVMQFENIIAYPEDAEWLNGDTEVEYIRRTTDVNGNEIFIRFNVRKITRSENTDMYYVSVINVTERILHERSEERNNALYKLLLNDSDEMLFIYNAENGSLTYSCRNADGIRVEAVNEKFREELRLGSGTIHPEMSKSFLSVLVDAAKRPRDGSIDYLAKRNSDDYRWFRAYYKSIENRDSQTYTVIGRSVDIQSEVEKIGSLNEQISLDLLTKIFNRITGEKYIREKLESAKELEKYAFIILDIDNFKSYNDTFGHPVGDIVIKNTAAVLKDEAPRDSITSRFGGDEFTIFFRYRSDDDYISKSEAIMNKVKSVSASVGIAKEITLSVGISLYPKDGKTFDELFSKADRAMYVSKQNGKNKYTVFSEK